jgi:hypothetical protein
MRTARRSPAPEDRRTVPLWWHHASAALHPAANDAAGHRDNEENTAMANATPDVQIETPNWAFDDPSIHQEHPGPRAQPGLLAMARHPANPFRASIRDDGNDIRPLLFELARQYLLRVPALAALPLPPTTDGEPGTLGFGWLALTWGDPAQQAGHDPRLSFWVERTERGVLPDGTEGRVRRDRTAVLLAGNRIVLDGATASAGGSIGLRVVLHVSEPQNGRSQVRVSGLSTSGLEPLLAPGPLRVARSQLQDEHKPDDHKQDDYKQDDQKPGDPKGIDFGALRRGALGVAKAAFGFSDAPALHGLVTTPGLAGEYVISGVGQRGPAGARRVFAWTALLNVQRSGSVLPTGLIEQRSHMLAPDAVLARDPASRGDGRSLQRRSPTRRADGSHGLDSFRSRTAMLPPPVGTAVTLADPRVEVLRSRVGNPSTPTLAPIVDVPDETHPLRSDDLAAVHAYLRGQEFFARLDAYGLAAASYFKMARLPLLMRPRASFYYASNGETVNAQVSPDVQGQSISSPFAPLERPQLQVAFGSANLSHREMLANNEGSCRAQPLGLAADPRWSWHEFGHVLNFASTGELEFRFAHSAGDALAAIVADPDARLDRPERVRNLTFPWAMMRRSHARPALLGWCWCGQRSRLRQSLRAGPPPIPGGYFEEELMASSLFRLYEAIGGAGIVGNQRVNTQIGRRRTSDFVVYLIMRAIALLGPATLVPARSADAFVSALIDADIGTGVWNLLPSWPEGVPRLPQKRLGGAVHKVIRWAFERQGLYATDDATEQREGPGLPPKVDIYIPGSGARVAGGYEPVELRWSNTTPRPWHAGAASIVANGARLCRVLVRNRGSDTATAVSARMWASAVGAGALAWQPLDPAVPGLTKDVSSSGNHYLAFEQAVGGVALAAGRYLVLAEVSCAADRANTDPAAALPCGDPSTWTDPALLLALIANDNNLGLRIVDFQ